MGSGLNRGSFTARVNVYEPNYSFSTVNIFKCLGFIQYNLAFAIIILIHTSITTFVSEIWIVQFTRDFP